MFVALLLLPLPALAQWATITSPVNVRAGPSHQFPVVTWLSTGTRVTVVGCTSGWRWCDISWGRRRGWVNSRYLGGFRPGGRTPIVRFSVDDYWNAHYRSSAWYSSRSQWNGWGQPSFRPPPPPPGRRHW